MARVTVDLKYSVKHRLVSTVEATLNVQYLGGICKCPEVHSIYYAI